MRFCRVSSQLLPRKSKMLSILKSTLYIWYKVLDFNNTDFFSHVSPLLVEKKGQDNPVYPLSLSCCSLFYDFFNMLSV